MPPAEGGDAPAAERRRRDRRQVPRPQTPVPAEVAEVAGTQDGPASGLPARAFGPGGSGGPGWPGEGEQARLRILRVYLVARLVVAAALAGVQLASAWLGLAPGGPTGVVAGLYAAQVAALWLVPRLRSLMLHPDLQRHAQARW
ncbi:MAG: hypothetical protein ACKO6D_08495, partial [Rubrivivax sp.]